MRKGKQNISVRLDERTSMLLTELSGKTKMQRSSLVRSMIKGKIDQLIDGEGNWKIGGEDKKVR